MSEIKIGDWIEANAYRSMIYDIRTDGDRTYLCSVTQGGCMHVWYPRDVTHLPDCTGWDWKPALQLKEGAYYENADGKIVGPLYRDSCGKWVAKIKPDGSGHWYRDDGTNVTPEWSLVRECDPPKPSYRHFKDVWEMLEHAKDRAIDYNGNSYIIGMLDIRAVPEDLTVARLCSQVSGWSPWLTTKSLNDHCTFADTGEPCGVRVDP
jgi:hypothetical protein